MSSDQISGIPSPNYLEQWIVPRVSLDDPTGRLSKKLPMGNEDAQMLGRFQYIHIPSIKKVIRFLSAELTQHHFGPPARLSVRGHNHGIPRIC
jgi:hypothetical protein